MSNNTTTSWELTNSSADGSQSDAGDRTVVKVIIGSFLYLVVFITIVGNAMVLLAVARNKRLQTVFNMYIVNLAVTDISVAITAMSFYTTENVVGHWPFGQFMCGVWIFFDYGMTFASVFTLLAISLDRLWAVRWSLHYRTRKTKARTGLGIAIVWMVMLVLWLPACITDRLANSQPGVCIWEPSKNQHFVPVIAVIGHHGSCIIIISCYVSVLLMLRRRTKVGVMAMMADNHPTTTELSRNSVDTDGDTAALSRDQKISSGGQQPSSSDQQRSGALPTFPSSCSSVVSSPAVELPDSTAVLEEERREEREPVKKNARRDNNEDNERVLETKDGKDNINVPDSHLAYSEANNFFGHEKQHGERFDKVNGEKMDSETNKEVSNQADQANGFIGQKRTVKSSMMSTGVSYRRRATLPIPSISGQKTNNRIDQAFGNDDGGGEGRGEEPAGEVSCRMNTTDHHSKNIATLTTFLPSCNEIFLGKRSNKIVPVLKSIPAKPALLACEIERNVTTSPEQRHPLTSSLVHESQSAPSLIDTLDSHAQLSISRGRLSPDSKLSESHPRITFTEGSFRKTTVTFENHNDNEGYEEGYGRKQKKRPRGRGPKGQLQSMGSKEMRAFVTLSYIVISYVICWVPFHIVFDISAIRPDLVPNLLYTVTFWMTYLNSTINPVLYNFSSKDFRKAFKDIVCRS